jgi:hypothetical protein
MQTGAWKLMAMLVSFMGIGGSAFAQQSDAEWLAQCRSQQSGQSRYCEVRPVSWPAGGPIRVDARPNGGIEMTGWDKATVAGSARIQAQGQTDIEAREVASQIVVNTGGGTLKADGPKGGSWSVSFVLSAPRQSDLELATTNGPITINTVSGRIEANAVNGPVALHELGGDVRVRTANGPITVALGGDSWQGAGLDVEAQNGPIKVQIPDGYSAQLDMGTTNGPIHSSIPVSVQSPFPGIKKSIAATLGAGGAPIRAHTQNGPLTVEKR